MRSWLTYIFLSMVACATVLTSCTDVLSEEGFGNCDDRTTVRLTISFGGDNGPMSRDVDSDNGTIPELDPTTPGQAEINNDDIYALVIDENDKFLYRIKDLQIINGPASDNYYTRTLEGTMIQTNNNVRIVLLANLIQNKIKDSETTYLDSKAKVEALIDSYDQNNVQTLTPVSTIYSQLIYNYDGTITTDSETNTQVGTGPWSLSNRRIPMWGQSQETTVPPAKDVTLTCYLYRAVAKVQIWVNEKKGILGADGVEDTAENDDTQDDFKITKITVNNANNQGYCVSQAAFDNNSTHYVGIDAKPYAAPFVPGYASQTVVYEVSDSDSNEDRYNDARKAYSDFIYLPEQFNTGKGNTPVTLSVEYVYNGKSYIGENALTIHFKENGTGDAFDVIRNHSYIFNIVKAENDIAFEVKVAPWEEDNMRGVPDQYTLTTDKSVITYPAFNDVSEQPLTIWTDYSDGWYIEWPKDENNNTIEADWLTISDMFGVDNVKKTITLKPESFNKGVTRTASFYVVAGNIKKEITVIMPQPPTANCYIAEEGENELIISIKGNGNDGILPEGADIVPGDGDASLNPDKIGIIWETKAGLITLIDGDNDAKNNVTIAKTDNTDGELKLVDYIPTSNSIKYNVADLETLGVTGAKIGGVYGGNALIGAFKYNQTTQKYEVIWSWHIWVAPGLMSDITTQTVNEDYVEKWTLNDYDVLDRNLGALSNRPVETQTDNTKSVASMGLLYQWGRKDPFIGAAYSNDQFPSTNPTGVLPVVHYYEDWDAKNINSDLIDYTITHPTHLIYGGTESNATGLSSVTAIDEEGKAKNIGGYLWGTNNGLSTTVKDLGSKTIYDPCPVGYRVPPVDAFVFKSPRLEPNSAGNWTAVSNTTLTNVYIQWATSGGTTTVQQYERSVNPLNDLPNNTFRYYRVLTVKNTTRSKSSDVENWNENLKYVPHNVSSRSWQSTGSGNSPQYIYNYSGDYVRNANYYGFYLNYTEIDEPITQYGSMYLLKDDDPDKITWLPLTGAYDPTKGVSFKSGNSTITIEQGSSITVNSFLWTNSSVLNGTQRIPAAMFLHGTETGGGGSGRHIHGMTQDNIKAEPHYAGAVRCVRDRAKTKWDINSLSSTARIGNTVGSTTTINIVSVNADWELIDPGQPWLQVTPDKGSADKGAGTEITLKMLEADHSGKTTTLVFKIANESEVRKCVVTVE